MEREGASRKKRVSVCIQAGKQTAARQGQMGMGTNCTTWQEHQPAAQAQRSTKNSGTGIIGVEELRTQNDRPAAERHSTQR